MPITPKPSTPPSTITKVPICNGLYTIASAHSLFHVVGAWNVIGASSCSPASFAFKRPCLSCSIITYTVSPTCGCSSLSSGSSRIGSSN
ncbi:hypothetical protein D3C77_622310 [compost metagenome]